ncbi:DUF4012 domain-containing protein [Candidatus Saccharibacteria bacterium]|nr:DUF4012 domain-containing protein [Candidatus Saccharibacteria bacterium]
MRRQILRVGRPTLLISCLVFLAFLFITRFSFQDFFISQQKKLDASNRLRQVYDRLSGKQTAQTTLVLFANNAEQRTGGGFIGTAGILKGSQGVLKLDSVRSVYYYDHRLEDKSPFIEPPDYLRGLTSTILTRDSLVDYRMADNCNLARDLFARETGVFADNVVIITPNIAKSFLDIIGPIELPEYNIIARSDTLMNDIQIEVESGDDKQAGKDPKTILSVLTGKIIERIPTLTIEQIGQLLDEMPKQFVARQIYVSSSDHFVDRTLAVLQDSIAVPGSPATILVTAANHAANKSSQAIVQSLKADLFIAEDGTAKVSMAIKRQHTSDYYRPYIDPRDNTRRWLIGDDLSWVQVVLPRGSEIAEDQGWRMMSDKSSVAVTAGRSLKLTPKSEQTILLSYTPKERYVLSDKLVIKQAFLAQFGWYGQNIDFRVHVPSGYRLISGDGQESDDRQGAFYKGFQVTDKAVDFVFKRT